MMADGQALGKRPAGDPAAPARAHSPPKLARVEQRQSSPAAGPQHVVAGAAGAMAAASVDPSGEHGGDGSIPGSSTVATAASTPNEIDRPTSPLCEQPPSQQQQHQQEEMAAVVKEAEAEETDAAAAGPATSEHVGALEDEADDEEEEEEEEEQQPQPQQQQQHQQQPPQRGAGPSSASNGVEHWLMVQRLKGTDPSVLALSLIHI